MNEIEESVAQCLAAWRLYVEPLAEREVFELPGLSFIWGNAALSFYNAVFLTGAVAGRTDIAGCAARVSEFMRRRPVPGMLVVCEDRFGPELQADVPGILAGAGLYPGMTLTGMAADFVAPPAGPLPPLEFRRVNDPRTAAAISDINSHAYGLRGDWGRRVLAWAVGRAWGPDEHLIGFADSGVRFPLPIFMGPYGGYHQQPRQRDQAVRYHRLCRLAS